MPITESKSKEKWFIEEDKRFNDAQIEPKNNNENWDFDGLRIVQRQYNTHFFHHYTAKFIPQIPQNVIKQFKNTKNDIVFDPFLGSGTTMVEGKLSGHPSFGIEINPLAIKIARAKVTPVDFETVDAFCNWLLNKRREQEKPKNVKLFKDSHLWFRDDVAYAIYNILQKISDYEDDTKNFIEIALSDHLKGASNALMHRTMPTLPDGDTYIDRKHYDRKINNKTRKIDLYGRVFAQLLNMKAALRYMLLKSNDVRAEPILGDSRKLCDYLSKLDINRVNVTVTSPPYWNAQNYQKLHYLSFQTFDLKEPNFGEIGRDKYSYLKDMECVISQLSQISKGHFAFVIGEDTNGGELHKKLFEMIVLNDFTPVKQIRRKISNQVGFTKSIPYEWIFIFKK